MPLNDDFFCEPLLDILAEKEFRYKHERELRKGVFRKEAEMRDGKRIMFQELQAQLVFEFCHLNNFYLE